MNKTIKELEQEYDFELGKIEKEVKKGRCKRVLLQFPDGIKPYATVIVEELEKRCLKTEFLIWFGSCFGACDVPVEAERLKVDLIVQFGHTAWEFGK